jgi:hypothetical protein
MKILLFSLVLLFSCAHISYGMKIEGGSNGQMYPGGSQGYKRAECRNRGGKCLDDMCYNCDTLPSPPQYKLPVERGPFPKVPANADAKAVATKPCGPGDALFDNHDCCLNSGQDCICDNTKWSGKCDYGEHKPGLYCRCD